MTKRRKTARSLAVAKQNPHKANAEADPEVVVVEFDGNVTDVWENSVRVQCRDTGRMVRFPRVSFTAAENLEFVVGARLKVRQTRESRGAPARYCLLVVPKSGREVVVPRPLPPGVEEWVGKVPSRNNVSFWVRGDEWDFIFQFADFNGPVRDILRVGDTVRVVRDTRRADGMKQLYCTVLSGAPGATTAEDSKPQPPPLPLEVEAFRGIVTVVGGTVFNFVVMGYRGHRGWQAGSTKSEYTCAVATSNWPLVKVGAVFNARRWTTESPDGAVHHHRRFTFEETKP